MNNVDKTKQKDKYSRKHSIAITPVAVKIVRDY